METLKQYEESEILNKLRAHFIEHYTKLGKSEIVLPDKFEDKNVNVDVRFNSPITKVRYNSDTKHIEVYVSDWGYGWYDAEVTDCGNPNYTDRNGATILERAGISVLSRALDIKVSARKVYEALI